MIAVVALLNHRSWRIVATWAQHQQGSLRAKPTSSNMYNYLHIGCQPISCGCVDSCFTEVMYLAVQQDHARLPRCTRFMCSTGYMRLGCTFDDHPVHLIPVVTRLQH